MRDARMRHRSARAKALALAALLLAPTGAGAASPDDDYVAARDRAIAAVKTLEDAKDWPAAKLLQEKDAKDLEQRLKAMVGPFALAGFSADGKLDADLSGGAPFAIDGLAYHAADEQASDDFGAVIVTTDGLLDKWLLHHPRRWTDDAAPDHPEPPRIAAAAVATLAFYNEGLREGGDIALYATIPVVPPPGAKFARAMLAVSAIGPELSPAPDRLLLAFEKGGRVFIANVKPTTEIKPIAACDRLRGTYEHKANLAGKAYNNSGANQKLQERLEKQMEQLAAQGQAAFLSCFNDKAKTTPGFEAARKQTAALVEALARLSD
jgi:hypothetical protein